MASRQPFAGERPGVARPILRLVAATMATQFLRSGAHKPSTTEVALLPS